MFDFFPLLKKQGLKASFCYEDSQMDDALLNLEVLFSAHKKGALLVNYTKALKCLSDRVLVENTMTKDVFEIKTKQIVSTLGPFTDGFFSQSKTSFKPFLTPTKGVHLIFSQKDLPAKKAMVIQKEKRILFVIPQVRDKVLVGTTDTEFLGNPRDVNVTKEDVDYLFSSLKEYFPDFQASYNKIISCFSGVRPLVRESQKSESAISRKEKIIKKENITFLIGGKYTTFRPMAKKTVDSLTSKKFTLHNEPLRKLDFRQDFNEEKMNSTKGVFFQKILFEDYEFIKNKYSFLYESLKEEEKNWALLAHWALHKTMCLHLKDFFRLRTDLTLFEPEKVKKLIGLVSSIFQKELKWSEKEILQQKEDCLKSLTFHSSCF